MGTPIKPYEMEADLTAQHSASITDDPLAALAAAAHAKDEHAFIAARQQIDWRARPPAEFMRAVRLALMAGAYRAARNLSAEGAAQYPDDAELQKAARVLAPPRVVGRKPADPSMEANMVWLRAHAGEHRGQWVAIRKGQFLGAATTLDELAEQVGDIKGVFVAPIH